MSSYVRMLLGLGLMLVSAAVIADLKPGMTPGLGEEPDQPVLDLVVLRDGTGLPPGSGTVADGQELHKLHCPACHGNEGQGGLNDRLAGGHGTLTSDSPVKTIGSYWPYAVTVFDFVRRAMPYTNPGSLTDDEVYAVTAYLLFINGVVGESDTLTADNLAKVKMPNRE